MDHIKGDTSTALPILIEPFGDSTKHPNDTSSTIGGVEFIPVPSGYNKSTLVIRLSRKTPIAACTPRIKQLPSGKVKEGHEKGNLWGRRRKFLLAFQSPSNALP